MSTGGNFGAIEDLLRRICAEYAEMPGLRVTNDQAKRLWGLDAALCREALDSLVDVKFLMVTSSGQYVRLTEGAPTTSNLRMATAALKERARRQRAG